MYLVKFESRLELKVKVVESNFCVFLYLAVSICMCQMYFWNLAIKLTTAYKSCMYLPNTYWELNIFRKESLFIFIIETYEIQYFIKQRKLISLVVWTLVIYISF